VATWIKRSDLTATIPDFVALAEARINRELRTRNMATRAQNASVNSEFVRAERLRRRAKRSGCRPAPYTQLDFLSPEQMADYKATSPTGTLTAFSVVGGEFWFLPVQSTAVAVELSYYAKLPALSDIATTNWLLTSSPRRLPVGRAPGSLRLPRRRRAGAEVRDHVRRRARAGPHQQRHRQPGRAAHASAEHRGRLMHGEAYWRAQAEALLAANAFLSETLKGMSEAMSVLSEARSRAPRPWPLRRTSQPVKSPS
jgi:hypothetical protein